MQEFAITATAKHPTFFSWILTLHDFNTHDKNKITQF